jgi:hypothetical protein
MTDVVYVVGSRWKQRYLVKNPATGNLQFMDNSGTPSTSNGAVRPKNDWETQCATPRTGYA